MILSRNKEAERRRVWRAAVSRRNRYETRARIAIAREIDRTARHVTRLLRTDIDPESAIVAASVEHRLRLRRIITREVTRIWLAESDVFRSVADTRLRSLIRARRRRKSIEVKVTADEAETLAAVDQLLREESRSARSQWLDNETPLAVQNITATTQTTIRDALREATEQGLGIEGATRLIYERTGGEVAGRRAWTIARTELHGAAEASTANQIDGLGTFEDELGFSSRRQWVSAEDERRRPSHKRAHGQFENEDGKFRVGGTLLRYPGDPSGQVVSVGDANDQSRNLASEIIHCRCIGVLVLEDTLGELED